VAVKQTHPGEGVGEPILLMMTRADGEEEDVAITITEVIILRSLGAIVIHLTVEKKEDDTDRPKIKQILARCQTRLHIIGMTTGETEAADPRTGLIIITDTDIEHLMVTLEVMDPHPGIITVKSSVTMRTRRWCQLWM